MKKPLEDVRVIALEQYGAGPFGTLHLAELGAVIIKIEDPTTKGDVSRYIPPFQEDSNSLFFERFKQPAVLGYILAGVLLGPSVLNSVQDRESIETLAELGVQMLLFLIGMELSL